MKATDLLEGNCYVENGYKNGSKQDYYREKI